MTALFYFPSRAERKAIAAGDLVLAPNGTLAVAGSQSPGVECCPAAAGTPQQELPLSGAPDAPAPADAGTSPGYTNGPASAGPPLSAALLAIAERRHRDMIEHGHTPEKDLRHVRGHLLYRGGHYVENAKSWLKKGAAAPADKRRACYRAAIVAACAFFIAELERLDAEPAHRNQEAA